MSGAWHELDPRGFGFCSYEHFDDVWGSAGEIEAGGRQASKQLVARKLQRWLGREEVPRGR